VRGWLAQGLGVADLMLLRDGRGRPYPALGRGAADEAHDPYLANNVTELDVNWSHSGDLLIAASGSGLRLGVDIEHLRPRPKALALAQRFFAVEETAWLAGLAADPARLTRDFTRLWCAKEAVLKAHGHGLSFGLHRLRFAMDGDTGPPRLIACDPSLGMPECWRLQAWTPEPGYWATLAWRRAGNEPSGERTGHFAL
jgi:4'-phosphopantetheinyl transferase